MAPTVANAPQMSEPPVSDKIPANPDSKRSGARFKDNKTRLCKSFLEGNGVCAVGDTCKFVHDVKAHTPKFPVAIDPQAKNKDLFKTKLCEDFLYRKCPRGATCHFAHHTSEMRISPNLAKTQLCTKLMNGSCFNPDCLYAHGEAELVKSPNFKTKLCAWNKMGTCRNGDTCAFAHRISDLCEESQLEWFRKKQPWNETPGFGPSHKNSSGEHDLGWQPGAKTKATKGEDDFDASTAVPSEESLAETDMSMMSNSHHPEEHMFRMMASRGSASLQQQVTAMTSAVEDLQAKLSQAEEPAMQAQVANMQRSIEKLEARLRTKQSMPPKVTTGVTQASAKKVKPWWDNSNVKMGLTVLLVAMMGAAEYALQQ